MQNNTKNNSETEQSQTETKQTRQQKTQNRNQIIWKYLESKAPIRNKHT